MGDHPAIYNELNTASNATESSSIAHPPTPGHHAGPIGGDRRCGTRTGAVLGLGARSVQPAPAHAPPSLSARASPCVKHGLVGRERRPAGCSVAYRQLTAHWQSGQIHSNQFRAVRIHRVGVPDAQSARNGSCHAEPPDRPTRQSESRQSAPYLPWWSPDCLWPLCVLSHATL